MNKIFLVLILFCASLLATASNADIPGAQNAIVQTGNGGPEVLSLETVPVLQPGPGEVLIKVSAAAINPIDWKMRIGYQGRGKPLGSPAVQQPQQRIPGLDVSGTVVEVGAGVVSVKIGDAVFSMLGRFQTDGLNGAYSQYVVVPAERAIAKPSNLSFAEAAGMATVGLTAARLLSPLKIEQGDRVFIDGIAGGVGSSVAQMALARGATVVGTASAKHHEYLRSIGVDEAIDYTKVKFEDVVEPVDFYIETVSKEIATRGLKIIKSTGQMTSSVGLPEAALCAQASVDCINMNSPRPGSTNGANTETVLLEQVRELAQNGLYRVNIDKTFKLKEAAAAQEYNRLGHTTGKVILLID